MDNNQQVFEGDFGDADLEADENLDWLAEFDWENPDMPVLPDQENVLLPQPEAPQFVMPLPNVQGEFEGAVLLPQEQEEQPEEGTSYFYDDFGHMMTEFAELEPDVYVPLQTQFAFGQNDEGNFVFAPRPY